MNETPDTIERFLYYLRYEVHASERTVCDYAQDLNRYAAFFSEHTGEVFEPSERDKDVARAWLFSLMEAGQKSSSVQRRLSALLQIHGQNRAYWAKSCPNAEGSEEREAATCFRPEQ